MALNSCLYRIKIWHDRQSPKRYSFAHDVFMFYLDLDEIDEISRRINLFGHYQNRIYDFQDTDHITAGKASVKANVLAYLSTKHVAHDIEKVFLLTNVRVFGYVFNPVSFYYCFDRDKNPVCVVVEIGNTFKELKYFFLGPQTKKSTSFKGQEVKYYYISPFTDMDHTLDFKIDIPSDKLNITIDVLKENQKYFYSRMTGARSELNSAQLWRMTWAYPWVTLKVIFLIHWHAGILHFFKRLAFHAKEETPELQKDVFRL